MRFSYFMTCFLWSSISYSGSIDPATAVNKHNEWRNLLNQGMLASQPRPNPFLADMYWDESLAESSQLHSDQCVWQHSGTGGENLYAHSGTVGSIVDAINIWSEEYTSYDYTSNESIDGQLVGHYTQVVWDDSLRVGCAKKYCNPLKYPDGEVLWPGTMYTCQYRSSGNWVGQKPYTISAQPDTIIDYVAANENVHLPLVKVGDLIFRVKMRIKTREPVIFETIAYEQLNGIDLNQYPNITTFDGSSLIIPQLTIDGTGSYKVKLNHLGDLDFELIEVKDN
jgi:hypothetical protein